MSWNQEEFVKECLALPKNAPVSEFMAALEYMPLEFYDEYTAKGYRVISDCRDYIDIFPTHVNMVAAEQLFNMWSQPDHEKAFEPVLRWVTEYIYKLYLGQPVPNVIPEELRVMYTELFFDTYGTKRSRVN